ncbi:methionine adenosyltransferase [Corynebacterium urealyticum]|uniref:S-adenosylmethionine synthase n=1 Tax=Corynebacterium urealyticum (strain ATCC 43042 / DSM 7109) TaxID=504474 RepID=METK_CORU7|nr:methionine adenosyltransferase [Corynebacterium urealyticum]B1VDN7.1 RecName: Full=S-adenosylmethionine synthase; Short=AdoMet synthase; AltName: Full=MAT; AltName: Full=Methionine adenosyltransferase [Corynebacterium urealyticum DSM 7109]AGE36552.1 S-adenosylmethionine synthetase [Corynebacterium urealyticum DSM 7111]QQB08195.1 methionine adenosyltransferase [Corynebacterium urealyticum]QQC41617.1 methionine adenosyltransferase [Corynebacterium urealyticum]QQE50240.1 methionine adenosyltra
MSKRLFTSESVTEGHPDKICDAISDTILDAMLTEDPQARVAVETVVTTGLVHVVGEVRTSGYVEIPQLVRDTLKEIGFTSSDMGFDGTTCGVSVSIGAQSPEIGAGVDTSHEVRGSSSTDEDDRQGAGDQGLMFGYATNETPEYMPLPISVAHRLSRRLTEVRKEEIVTGLRPDGKTQVTFEYDDAGTPVRLDTVVISTQHDPERTQDELRELLSEHVVGHVLADESLKPFVTEDLNLLVNPSGSFILGGPAGDAGLTGRKIIVDTYGGMARHGGGAFSGKDPSKVDRSAAYATRWVAKNIVAAGLADRAEVQVAYAIGVARPVGLYVETFGTEKAPVEDIQRAVAEVFDLRPASILRELDLLRPIYAQTAAYGHFGRNDLDLPWERLDKVEELKKAVGGN